MAKGYGLGSLLMDIGAIAAAPFTYGASLVASPSAHALIGDTIGSIGGGSDNRGIEQAQESYKNQLEQYKTLSEERRKDLERLQKELEETTQKIKSNDEEMDRLRAIINDPNKSEDEKSDARKKLDIIEGENDDLKRKLRGLEDKVKEIENNKPTVPAVPWNLPKLNAYDKLLMTGVLALVIYYLFLKEDKKK